VFHNVARMVVVASGSPARVQRWGDSLRAASITFVIETCESALIDHSELWVSQDDVDEARSAIRSDPGSDKTLLW
jgi:hypothetical protein